MNSLKNLPPAMRRLLGRGYFLLKNGELVRSPIADPTDYLTILSDPGDSQLGIYARVSPSSKDHQKSLDGQLGYQRHKLGRYPIANECREIADGRSHSLHERYQFIQQLAWARSEIRAGRPTIIVAESPSRFIRNPIYSDLSPRLPTENDFQLLMEKADGVPLGVLDKNDHLAKKRGQHYSGNPGGRDWKSLVNRREKLRPQAIKLREEGYSIRQIAGRLNVPPGSVYDWVR
jgi:hypothetical protein